MKINKFFNEHKRVAVAFSGGVDSAVLLMLAKNHAEKVKAYFVKSQFQPAFELEDTKKISSLLDVELEVIALDALSDELVAKNPQDRCYHCKKHVFDAICAKAKADGFPFVLDGTNASDDENDRPGMKALFELGILSPLKECGLDKEEIRRIAAEAKLPVADKPSYACLATRIPTGKRLTVENLSITEKAEDEMRRLGFRNFRVRFQNGGAKLELGTAEFEKLLKKRREVLESLSEYYDGVTLDLKERKDE